MRARWLLNTTRMHRNKVDMPWNWIDLCRTITVLATVSDWRKMPPIANENIRHSESAIKHSRRNQPSVTGETNSIRLSPMMTIKRRRRMERTQNLSMRELSSESLFEHLCHSNLGWIYNFRTKWIKLEPCRTIWERIRWQYYFSLDPFGRNH